MPSGTSADSFGCSGQRLTDPNGSGRFCPQSGHPRIECLGTRQGHYGECVAHLPPDAILSSRIPRSRKAVPHARMNLPLTFAASSEQALGSLVAERLQGIFPETDASEAVLCMDDASLALSLSRSYQGITASAFKDLVPLFEMTLRGSVSDEKIDVLEDILEAEIESAIGHLDVNMKAQRVKGVFHLLNAAALRLRSPPPSTTA